MPPELLPVVQITIPLIVAGFIAVYAQNKRFDDLRADMRDLRTDMNAGFEKINATLKEHGERIARLEGRIPPLVRN